jgi:hypothetical protein
MAAIVTNKFRIVNAKNFKEDLSQTGVSTYVYIAKSDAWSNTYTDITDSDPPVPADSLYDERAVHDNMIAMKILTSSDISHVVPRNNWVQGSSYYAYDDGDDEIFDKPFYALTDEYKVYKCIRAGAGASTIKPVHTNTQFPQTEGDGYTWKYMYTLQATQSDKFLTNYYMPVKTVVDDGNLSTDDQAQYDAQVDARTAGKGAIYRIAITNGGTDYTIKPTITIEGNGTGAVINSADITLSGGAITSITLSNNGINYDQANVIISGGNGTGATARAILSPGQGHGTDPVTELGAFFVATNVKLEYAEGSGDFIVDNAFRQVGLIRNPFNYGTTNVSTATTLSGLNQITVSGADIANISEGDVIQGQSSEALAIVDSTDTDLGIVKFHQNFKTGWDSFQAGEAIAILGGAVVGTNVVLGAPEYARYSGEIMFIENRDPINRYSTQIEDIKIIIEF